MPTDWQQLNITFADRATAQHVIASALTPALLAAETSGLHSWWFMNKQPWPLRYQHHTPGALALHGLLDQLAATGQIITWTHAIYEPERHAFGGDTAMDAAHALFHHDSRHLLTYAPSPAARHLGRRETSMVLCTAMMRAAGLDWYEQGDVWATVAEHRPHPHPLPPRKAAALTQSVRTLMSASIPALCDPAAGGPLAGAWIAAFEEAGKALGHLARTGHLTRGLRAVLAHHLLFHFNRAGLSLQDQSTLSALAKVAVMGTSDSAPSAPTTRPARTSVGPVNSDTIDTTDAAAERLRHALVDQIKAQGGARLPRTEAAMRTVRRDLFVPEVPLEAAYANRPVDIKYDTDGTSISCASQPGVVALMLDQLDAQPGEHVLELGAGTGYNAALLGHLVGEKGHVTTLDVDDDLVEGARAHLAAAGATNVEVLTRDGALGHAHGAPYHRIIATVGAHGIPHAWLDQLAPGGRLVTPQRLKGSVSRSIVYESREGRWISLGSQMNTFMPLRRGIADDDRRVIPLSTDGTVRLQAPAGQNIDADTLAGVLDQPRTEEWTGVTVRAVESPEWMELYVSCSVPSGLIRMLFPHQAKGTLLTNDPYPSSTAAVDKGAVTYLARRLADRTTPEGDKLWEFGVIGHGPGGEELAATVADAVQTWDHHYRNREATFEIQDLDAPAIEPRPGRFTLETPLNRIVVDWH
ncbi:methyltransferase, FxLD system [Streptomyces sp. C36]|uniref:methyltransferase, FxLD system n=1 Tax=Streptomyces sp. C36 TaxID=3237122 RepID=UPI0034C613A0